MNPITCGMAADLLPLYLDGCCSADSRAALEAHMDACPACRAQYAQLRRGLTPAAEDPGTDGIARALARKMRRRKRCLRALGAVLGVLLGKLSFGWLVGVLVYAAALALVLRSWAHFQEAVFPVWRWMVAFCASACMFVWVYLGTILAEGVLWQGIWYEVGRQGRVIRMRRQK